jgi:hypothetical protein
MFDFFGINAIINYNRYNIGGFNMAKNKIDDIESQIEKLKKKKAELIARREKEVGAYLIKSWGLSDYSTKDILGLIDEYNPNKDNKSNNVNSNSSV